MKIVKKIKLLRELSVTENNVIKIFMTFLSENIKNSLYRYENGMMELRCRIIDFDGLKNNIKLELKI